jgi:hypothetical protein
MVIIGCDYHPSMLFQQSEMALVSRVHAAVCAKST